MLVSGRQDSIGKQFFRLTENCAICLFLNFRNVETIIQREFGPLSEVPLFIRRLDAYLVPRRSLRGEEELL